MQLSIRRNRVWGTSVAHSAPKKKKKVSGRQIWREDRGRPRTGTSVLSFMSPGGASGPFVVVFGIRLQTTNRPHEAQWQRVTEEESRCAHVHVPCFCATEALQMSCFPKVEQMETRQRKCHQQKVVTKISSYSLRLDGRKEADADHWMKPTAFPLQAIQAANSNHNSISTWLHNSILFYSLEMIPKRDKVMVTVCESHQLAHQRGVGSGSASMLANVGVTMYWMLWGQMCW